MSRRQKAINLAVKRNHQNKQYIFRKRNNIYPKRTLAGYKFYKPVSVGQVSRGVL